MSGRRRNIKVKVKVGSRDPDDLKARLAAVDEALRAKDYEVDLPSDDDRSVDKDQRPTVPNEPLETRVHAAARDRLEQKAKVELQKAINEGAKESAERKTESIIERCKRIAEARDNLRNILKFLWEQSWRVAVVWALNKATSP